MEVNSRYNYYDVLEISTHCPQHEISTAYERARSTYSGENPAIYTMFTNEEARALLKLVEEAYSVLGNKTLRALYDEKMGQRAPESHLNFESLQMESKVILTETPKRVTPNQRHDYKVDEKREQEIRETKDWDGVTLKKVREYKGYTLEKLSEKTKVGSYYINAIESVDPKNLPAPVYVRGYVAQISKTLGLDDRKVCESYMKFFRDAEKSK